MAVAARVALHVGSGRNALLNLGVRSRCQCLAWRQQLYLRSYGSLNKNQAVNAMKIKQFILT